MKDNAIKALLCIGTFILFVVLHTFYRMAGGNSSLVGAWIGNLLFLLPGISLPFYIWKKYPFRSVANEESFTAASDNENNSTDYISSVSRANSSSNPNTWLHPTDGTTTGEPPVNVGMKNSSSEKTNPSPSEELNQKLEQLKQLHKSGLLTDKELEEKSAKIKLDFRTTQALKKIQAIKQIKKDQLQSAVASGVLSEAEAQIKIKQIEDSVVCPYCENISASLFEYCPKCGLNEAGKLLNEESFYFCTRCDHRSVNQFSTCPNCGKQGLAKSADMTMVNQIILGAIFVLFVIFIGLYIAVGFKR